APDCGRHPSGTDRCECGCRSYAGLQVAVPPDTVYRSARQENRRYPRRLSEAPNEGIRDVSWLCHGAYPAVQRRLHGPGFTHPVDKHIALQEIQVLARFDVPQHFVRSATIRQKVWRNEAIRSRWLECIAVHADICGSAVGYDQRKA